MTKNPILEELHAVREQLLAEAGGSLDKLVERLQAEERQSDRPRYKPRHPNRGAESIPSSDPSVENRSDPTADR